MSASAAMTAEEDNPFRPGGELSEEAEGILRHSTISRDLVVIRDPASREASTIETSAHQTSTSGTEQTVEDVVTPEKAASVHASPKEKEAAVSGVVEIKVDGTGDRAEEGEVKTERITAQDPTSPAEVEHVQLKKKKGCCVMC